ncbi:hypothetical protein BDR06DRAFT_1009357 [Suillus hirtellus]|nr:hypothetical protein BDR06DRAFT_1009357 [Suillus hirtellus]
MVTIDAQDLRRMISRFRVLIIVRANASKTTILQKVCNTTDNPEIHNSKRKKIDAAIVKSSIKMYTQRGNHDITNEMVFKSNPSFVFHDSCGFEAGSEEELESMKRFILQHAHNKMRGANPCYLVLYSNGRPKSNIPAVGREVLLGV